MKQFYANRSSTIMARVARLERENEKRKREKKAKSHQATKKK